MEYVYFFKSLVRLFIGCTGNGLEKLGEATELELRFSLSNETGTTPDQQIVR
jgi:hypothetical protein